MEKTQGLRKNMEGSEEDDHKTCPQSRNLIDDALSYLKMNNCDEKAVKRVVWAWVKGFSIGDGLKGGLSLLSLLFRLTRGRPKSHRKIFISGRAVSSEDHGLLLGWIKETLRYGLFLAPSPVHLYVTVDESVATLGGRRRTAKWRALLAGGIAGPSMMLTGLSSTHTSLAVYILVRASVLATRCGIKSNRLPKLFKPLLTCNHADIFLMSLSAAQISSAYVVKQDSFAPSYKSFLNKQGGKDGLILQGLKEIITRTPISNLQGIQKYYKSLGDDIKLEPDVSKVPCLILHGNESCTEHALNFFLQAYRRAIPVYLPVYMVSTLLVHRKGLLKRPYEIMGKAALGISRSSLFLSSYCTSSWMLTCALFRIFKSYSIPLYALAMFPGGLSFAIEKKSRRMEIALYCLSHAIESFFSGYLPPQLKFKRADVVVFSLSTAIIMHCYAQERDVFRSKYVSVLDWVFGVPPPPSHAPQHSHLGSNNGDVAISA